MSNLIGPAGGGREWAVDKLNALRLGQWLVAEIPASAPGRQTFVEIMPITTPADEQARREGWKRSDRARTFRLEHWEFDSERLFGFDYDIGAVLVRTGVAVGEPELNATLQVWQLDPGQFVYPWQCDYPR
ncbi:hypothetical protein [Actinomadura livida]|uniref:Uncharacterized protein n=1 Tax=Actinomadura livida TaxID=79909 RepID=A0A7W7IFF9_9ACTN|nr:MULTISPECIES: hypothetical protein [Actinomadura]MBB4776139.1 hypothetical protein [Actinomadura catellatispora]GGU15216.1 hypothetical protein GCM10010208_45230 [Actinomadura livida]